MKTPAKPQPATQATRRQRDPSNTVHSFSVSKELLNEAKSLAREEKRSLSNLISLILEEKILERRRQRLSRKD